MPPPLIPSLPSQSSDVVNSPLSNSDSNSTSTAITSASIHSDDSIRNSNLKLPPLVTRGSPRSRRLSVSSLLSGPPGISSANESNAETQGGDEKYHDLYQDTNTWGVDRGFKDLDLGK